ncbi:MAG: substrate-binding domain-containing protein [Clostridia bacterium]|nr:substrate-binding domain-containing protein [Clostridia bacterium]
MKKLIALFFVFTLFLGTTALAEDTMCDGYPKPERFVTLKIPFPEELKENDSWRTVARYQDSGQAIPLSDCYGGYVYAIVPYENKDRAIEAFVPDKIPFTDNTASDYEFYVMENLSRVGVILGNEKGEALPYANVTRAEATAMIMRFLGLSPIVNSEMLFSDVSREDWFYGNVGALYEAGIVKGDSEITFSPHRNVTREEITVMVVRALQYADLRCPFRTEENISDMDSVSDWAKDAYEYIGVNYVSDYEGENADRPYRMLYPKKAASRYDIAYILDNTLKNCQLFATDLAVEYGFDQAMPVIDGSTSTYPFTEQVYRALFVNGTTHPQYPKRHSKSHASYERLINGEVDMLFASVYPAADILALAEEKGVELELIPIAYDAMIFFTNPQNPVNGLTKEQITEIYVNNSYETWKELGGNDFTLYPYCRNNDSGSHAQMEKHFLNGKEIHPKIQAETISETMSNILTDVMAVPARDETAYGLGYSIYYYFHNMDLFYDTKENLKLLAIDGVYPTDETIADGSYPLSNNTYIVLRKETPEGHPARKMAEFMLSEAGQACVELAGYGKLH